MASDRIGKKSARLVAVPPFEIVDTTTDFLLKQPTVKENIRNVPVNHKLVDSIFKEGIHNPHLTMRNWYPLAGSQRIRAALHIKENIDNTWNESIIVHRFLQDYHNIFYLWGDEAFRSKAIAIWFQLQELVFKSLYYEHVADGSGTMMTEFEDIGEELEWEHDRANSRDVSTIDSSSSMEHGVKNESS
tara:strand:- start:982 stop:1545 length:564 start_codon:yes stop_codon:yes gene_type:complete